MAKMRAFQVKGPNQPLERVERDIPQPTSRTVRVKVQACGICHSDSFVTTGAFPGIQYPRIPGHEVAGVIDAVGPDVTTWKVGDRVGIGWFGGNCFLCEPCRRGQFVMCEKGKITGVTFDGGYADYLIAPIEALAHIPDGLKPAEAAPLMCAGITTFNALRHTEAHPGDLVAILGMGGLGHLAIQYAAKMGFKTVAIARGKDKEPLAKKLGAHAYIDSTAQNVSEELKKLGGVKVVLSTVTNSQAMSETIGGLKPEGRLILLGVSGESLEISPLQLIMKNTGVDGWASGTSIDSEDTLAFSDMTGVRSMNEIFPLEKAPEAFERMMSGKARFRVVLETGL